MKREIPVLNQLVLLEELSGVRCDKIAKLKSAVAKLHNEKRPFDIQALRNGAKNCAELAQKVETIIDKASKKAIDLALDSEATIALGHQIVLSSVGMVSDALTDRANECIYRMQLNELMYEDHPVQKCTNCDSLLCVTLPTKEEFQDELNDLLRRIEQVAGFIAEFETWTNSDLSQSDINPSGTVTWATARAESVRLAKELYSVAVSEVEIRSKSMKEVLGNYEEVPLEALIQLYGEMVAADALADTLSIWTSELKMSLRR